MQFTQKRVFKLNFGPLLKAVKSFEALVLSQMFQAQSNSLSFSVRIVPLDAWFDRVPFLCADQFDVPDREIKTRSPWLNWDDFDVTTRKHFALYEMLKGESFWKTVVFQTTKKIGKLDWFKK